MWNFFSWSRPNEPKQQGVKAPLLHCAIQYPVQVAESEMAYLCCQWVKYWLDDITTSRLKTRLPCHEPMKHSEMAALDKGCHQNNDGHRFTWRLLKLTFHQRIYTSFNPSSNLTVNWTTTLSVSESFRSSRLNEIGWLGWSDGLVFRGVCVKARTLTLQLG